MQRDEICDYTTVTDGRSGELEKIRLQPREFLTAIPLFRQF